eukprot:4486757-Pyramimonas_sp.AAC.1
MEVGRANSLNHLRPEGPRGLLGSCSRQAGDGGTPAADGAQAAAVKKGRGGKKAASAAAGGAPKKRGRPPVDQGEVVKTFADEFYQANSNSPVWWGAEARTQ